MNIGALLEPLVQKAMKAKGYSRTEAVDKSWRWLARELGVQVEALKVLTDEQEWCAHALVEQAMLPAPKKHRRKIEIPETPKLKFPDKPLGTEFWIDLQKAWGTEFYAAFFGDWSTVKVEGTLAPGQYALGEIRKANASALIDAA